MSSNGMKDNLDPRSIITMVLVVSTLAILIREVIWLFAILATTLALLKIFGIKVMQVFPRLKRFISLFFFLLIVQSIFAPSGQPLLVIKGIQVITMGGIITGVSVILRMMIIITSAMLLITVNPTKMVLGLTRWRIPYEIAYMVLLAARFLPIFIEEMKDALVAVQLRGVPLKNIPLGEKLKVYSYILMPVVAGAILKAKKTAVAMEARAFRAHSRRTYIDEISLGKKDYGVIITCLFLGVLCYSAYLWRWL
ncbi:energy-coupling factor transporter transmembrane component T family protein [Candidatus Contubernalis alkaliaceticus]|uniref:energy-coupling factor transporter transmembrane component T family protein n=1 Tax=Candidatus Contubernalis alkaliaceticus TaxID=338645 RepID=UPI001F4BFE3E|nr:energy-coupling factor transporter transmembrane component T [Candidatus Contubernalis alkalaceticus]UNC91953.1 energy-coupling factor transporter transmembrane protein EcfT [Candidatus Contubernalis alkalaceticus]